MIRTVATALLAIILTGCCGASRPPPPVPSGLQTAIEKGSALDIADALESLIGDGRDTEDERQLAYDHVKSKEEMTAAYAYARAMVTGRLVQVRGLTAALLIREMEEWGQRSRALDPTFREGAATRMVGTLYVLAPASLLANGDSEKGLELIEQVAQEYPNVIENHLRHAEALIALGDMGPAIEPLCRCFASRGRLQRDDQALLDKLMVDAGSPPCAAPK